VGRSTACERAKSRGEEERIQRNMGSIVHICIILYCPTIRIDSPILFYWHTILGGGRRKEVGGRR